MDIDSLNRLRTLVEADPRSYRKISLDAGLGPNYVQQALSGSKDLTIDNLQALLATLGQSNIIYVLTGISAEPQDLEFLQLILSAPPSVRGSIAQIISAVQAAPLALEPPPSDDRSA